MTDNLKQQLKALIIDKLGLEDITPADIGDDTALFADDGLGLDSVDALELGHPESLQLPDGKRRPNPARSLLQRQHPRRLDRNQTRTSPCWMKPKSTTS